MSLACGLALIVTKEKEAKEREMIRYCLFKGSKSIKYEGQPLPWREAQRDSDVLKYWLLFHVDL